MRASPSASLAESFPVIWLVASGVVAMLMPPVVPVRVMSKEVVEIAPSESVTSSATGMVSVVPSASGVASLGSKKKEPSVLSVSPSMGVAVALSE